MRIVRLIDETNWKTLLPTLENIFFTTSTVQIFDDEQERESFKARWFGRYLDHYINSFFIARAVDGVLIGYLAGCLENPALNSLFHDLGCYRAFASYCALYPCHLHINVIADYRNLGVGAGLIEAFAVGNWNKTDQQSCQKVGQSLTIWFVVSAYLCVPKA